MQIIRTIHPLPMATISNNNLAEMLKYSDTEIYMDPLSMRYNTAHQAKKIQELEIELSNKKKSRSNSLQNLIAYYFNK